MLQRPVEPAKYVTVVIDLTPVRDGTGPARLLDMAEGRSKQVFKTWLEAQSPEFRPGVEIVAMDGLKARGVTVERVLSDNGSAYRSDLWCQTPPMHPGRRLGLRQML